MAVGPADLRSPEMEHLGNISITLFLINPTDAGQDPDNVFTRRMRRVTIFRKYQVTRAEAQAITAGFLKENCLDNQDKYQTQAVWCVTEYL